MTSTFKPHSLNGDSNRKRDSDLRYRGAMAEREDNRWVTLVLVCLAQFMVILDATIVNIALPTIQRELDFSQADLQWVINSYTLLFGGFLLLGGRAADILGRKRIFLAGTVIFSVASLLNGLAQSSEMLIAFRALQGLGGALVSPAALSIITTTFPEGPERTKALGVWSAIAAGGGAIGLLLGGILTEGLSWEWIFFVNVPVGAITVLLSARLIRESKSPHGAFDVLGAVFVTAGLMVLVYAIVKAESFGWGSGRTLALCALALALLASFLIIESRISGPLVRLGIFKIRSLAVSNFTLLLVAGGLFALFFFATLYVQEILGFKPIKAGFAFLPVALFIGVGAGTAQVLVKKLGVRMNTILGMACAALGLFYLSRVPVDGSYWTDLFPGLVLMAFGMGNTFVPITLIATTNVEAEDAGLASGLFNTSQQVGGALGLAVLSTLAADKTTSYFEGLGHQPGPQDRAAGLVEGFQVAFTSAAILVTVGAILLALLLRSRDVANVNPEQGMTVPA
jgi:EmrB/QacA subfamily drug resistance transporter